MGAQILAGELHSRFTPIHTFTHNDKSECSQRRIKPTSCCSATQERTQKIFRQSLFSFCYFATLSFVVMDKKSRSYNNEHVLQNSEHNHSKSKPKHLNFEYNHSEFECSLFGPPRENLYSLAKRPKTEFN